MRGERHSDGEKVERQRDRDRERESEERSGRAWKDKVSERRYRDMGEG